MKAMISYERRADPKPELRNPSFVGREYYCDDEVLGSHDGLYDEFGGDNYHITRDVGLAYGDDGCEPLVPETAEEYDERVYDEDEEMSYADQYEYFCSLEDADMRTAEAVAEALALQKFFRKRQEAEREAEEERSYLIRSRISEALTNEPEVKERSKPVCRKYSRTGQNRRSKTVEFFRRVERSRRYKVAIEAGAGIKTKYTKRTVTWTESIFVREYVTQAQRCHGATDNRRYRRGDVSGKMIGTNHRRRKHDHDIGRSELQPVAVILDDGRVLRVA